MFGTGGQKSLKGIYCLLVNHRARHFDKLKETQSVDVADVLAY
jgi:hypothetical protein